MHENINHIGIFIGNFLLPYYGFFSVIGLIVAFFIGYYQIKKYNLSFDNFMLLISFGGIFAIIGAKLLFLLVSFRHIEINKMGNLNYIKDILNGGFVFYGGLIGSLIGIYICEKIFKIKVKIFLRYCTPVISIMHCFGRIGCSLVGCCYGKPYNSYFSVIYSNSLFAPNNIALFPVQRIEAVILFFITIFLLVYINKLKGEFSFEIYILFYSIIRFILEFFRYDSYRGIFFYLTISQYISIFLILFIVYKLKYKNKKR